MIVPPYVESPDDVRCGQAVNLMILKHFMPQREWTFTDADKICGYTPGKWTWTTSLLMGMVDLGFETVSYSSFEKEKFINNPVEYLYEKFGKMKAKATLDNINLDIAIEAERRALTEKNCQHIKRDWQWDDVDRLLKEGYLLHCWVNSRKLYSRNDDKVGGHAILIFDYDAKSEEVSFHDPGSVIDFGNDQKVHFNAWKFGRVGTAHFMNAAKILGPKVGHH